MAAFRARFRSRHLASALTLGLAPFAAGCAHLDVARHCTRGALDRAWAEIQEYKSTWCRIGSFVGGFVPPSPQLFGDLGCGVAGAVGYVVEIAQLDDEVATATQAYGEYVAAAESAIASGDRCLASIRRARSQRALSQQAYEARLDSIAADRARLRENVSLGRRTLDELRRIVDWARERLGDAKGDAGDVARLSTSADELAHLVQESERQLEEAAPVFP